MINEKVEGSRYIGICGTSIGSYASQLALTNEVQNPASAPTHMITHIPLCTCYREVYVNIAC